MSYTDAAWERAMKVEEVDDGIWSIYFCDVLLARLDERDSIIRS